MTKKERIQKEIARLQKKLVILELEQRKPVVVARQESKPTVRAGEDLPNHQLCVVDSIDHLAYAYPATPIINGRRKIHGRTNDEYKKGELVSLKEWWRD